MRLYIKNLLIKLKNKLEHFDTTDNDFWNDLYKGDVEEDV